TTSSVDVATLSTSTADAVAVQTSTTDLVAAQTTSSSVDVVAQTSTSDTDFLTTSTTEPPPPAAVATTAVQDTTANAITTSDLTALTTSIPPTPPGVTSLPSALAPFTNAGVSTSLPPALAPFTNVGTATIAPAANAPLATTSTNIPALSDSLPESSGAALSLQQNRPSTFVTSITPTQVADSLPSSAGISAGGGSGSTGNVGPGGTGGNDVNGANGSGISATSANHSAMNKTTQAVGFAFIAFGALALTAGIVYLIRRMMRQRRLGKAISPPPSPLLNAISDPLPSGIQRSMSERSAMGTGRSEFWSSSDSNTMIGPIATGPRTYQPYRPAQPTAYRNENGTFRSELSANSGGGGVMGAFGVRNSMNRGPPELDGGEPKDWNLDLKDGWDEKMDISPLSPTASGATLAGDRGRVESMRVDGMRFEMVGESKRFEMPGDETFQPNEKPLGGRKAPRPLTAGLGQNPPNI
ncbi:hypothetical protein N431DRAFT_232425, partial [Stipitochalara longipes BDJ]